MAETNKFMVEVQVQTRLTVVDLLKNLANQQDQFAKQGAIAGKVVSDSLKKTSEHAGLVTQSLKAISTAFAGLGRAAGFAGLAVGVPVAAAYVVTNTLKNMSLGALNLHYTAKTLGLTTKDFVDIRQGLERVGLSHEEAGETLTAFFTKLRDITQKGPGSEFFHQMGSFGEGSKQLRDNLVEIYKTTGDGKKVMAAYVEALKGMNQWQRRQTAESYGLPGRVIDLNEAMKQNVEILLLNTDEARKYNNAWLDIAVNLTNFKTRLGADAIDALNKLYRELDRRGVILEFNKTLVDLGKVFLSMLNSIDPNNTDFQKMWERSREIRRERERAMQRQMGQYDPKNWAPPTGQMFQRQSYTPETGGYRSTGGPRAINVPTGGPPVQRASLNPLTEMRELLEVKHDSNSVLSEIQLSLTGGGAGTGTGTGVGATGYPAGQARRGIMEGGKAGMKGVDPELRAAVEEGAKHGLPAGYTWKYISGYRPGDPRFHGHGGAADIIIYDDKGKPIPNIGYGPGTIPYQVYERFAVSVRAAQERMYPHRNFIWGGHFRSGTPRDLMHMQWGGTSFWKFDPQTVESEIKRQQQATTAEKREGGGPVQAGRSYMVGERGPELFKPSESGQIARSDTDGDYGNFAELRQKFGSALFAKDMGGERWRDNIDGPETAIIRKFDRAERIIRENINKKDPYLPWKLGPMRMRGRVNLNVNAPAGTSVSATGAGMFSDSVTVNRTIMREIDNVIRASGM